MDSVSYTKKLYLSPLEDNTSGLAAMIWSLFEIIYWYPHKSLKDLNSSRKFFYNSYPSFFSHIQGTNIGALLLSKVTISDDSWNHGIPLE